MIVLRDVWFSYDAEDVLKGIDFEIRSGGVALLGPTGSGKTTLAKLILGILKPKKGEVIVFGKNTKEHGVSEISRFVGYVFQNPTHQIFANTVREELEFSLKNFKIENDGRVERIARELGIFEYLDESPFRLSLGLRERVAIASVLVYEPKILILDEPTLGQDASSYNFLCRVLRKIEGEGRIFILITHDLELVKDVCSRVILLKNGSLIFDGSAKEFFDSFDEEGIF